MKKRKSLRKSQALKSKEVIDSARSVMANENNISPTLKEAMEKLIDLTSGLVNQLGLNHLNSSKPPSQDKFGPKKSTASGSKRKPGAQVGHHGSYLKPVDNPTHIEEIYVDKETLPRGKYTHAGFENRQVFDVDVSVTVTEFRAEILVNRYGETFVADFPEGVTERTQYGSDVKAMSVYMSQFQLIPTRRVEDFFKDQAGLNISKGSIHNYNALAAKKLQTFEEWAKRDLIGSYVLHGDETGININAKTSWLHSLSNEKVVLFFADSKRGKEAMDRMGVLPFFHGILVHDHWKPYFRYDCEHSLCNAHHLRELQRAIEQDNQKWAKEMKSLLEKINIAVKNDGGALSKSRANRFFKKYRAILRRANDECPEDLKNRAQSKSRNLLERLQSFETEVLRFMEDPFVPFTNNQGENNLRMTKVQQKISGCFRSKGGADNFCRVRGYILTCQKHGLSPTKALKILFDNKLPDFVK
jgi:transposase